MMYRAYLGLRALRYEPGRGKKLLATAPLSLKFVRQNLPSSFVVDTLIPPSPTEPTPSLKTTNLDSGLRSHLHIWPGQSNWRSRDRVKVRGCESSACLLAPPRHPLRLRLRCCCCSYQRQQSRVASIKPSTSSNRRKSGWPHLASPTTALHSHIHHPIEPQYKEPSP